AAGTRESRAHPFARREDPPANVGGAFASVLAQMLERDARNVHAQVDPVEERARESPSVALNLLGKARAVPLGITPEPTGTWVHRGDEDKPRGVCRRAARARDRDRAFLERLAEGVENIGRELRDLVQKKSAAVSQANFAGPRRRSAADEREVGGGVMRCAERSRGEHGMARVGEAGDAVDRAGGN